MSRTVEPDLAAARDAARRNDWREAFELLLSADGSGRLEPDDLDLLAEVAWWLYRLDVSIAARERAYQGFLRLGDSRRAATVAIDLAKHHYAKGQSAIGAGYLASAERLLSAEPECVERGYLARIQSALAFEGKGDFDAALEHADAAMKIASRFQDRDLLALAVHDRGRVLVAKGLVAEGNALLDEATVAAVAGELKPMSTGIIYCNVISSCEELADYRRAGSGPKRRAVGANGSRSVVSLESAAFTAPRSCGCAASGRRRNVRRAARAPNCASSMSATPPPPSMKSARDGWPSATSRALSRRSGRRTSWAAIPNPDSRCSALRRATWRARRLASRARSRTRS